MAEGTNLLKISMDGEVVAEALLTVYDADATWRAFQDAFANLAPLLVGEIFNTVRVACDTDLSKQLGPQGITIDLRTSAVPQLVIPSPNGHLKGL